MAWNGKELTLDELLADPIVRQVMQRDGVRPQAVREVMRKVKAARLRRDVEN